MNGRGLLACATAGVLLFATQGAAASSLVVNGDFEAGGGSLAGWDVTPAVAVGTYESFSFFGAHSAGDQADNHAAWFQLANDTQMRQWFDADPALYYLLTFDYAVIGTGVKSMNVGIGDEQHTIISGEYYLNPTQLADNNLSTSFRTYHKRFEGLSGPVFLLFDDAGQGNGSTRQLIDNVSLVAYDFPIGIGVPEPASWGLLILGFGCIGAVARRRSQRADTAYATVSQ